MSPGTPPPAAPRAGQAPSGRRRIAILRNGGFTFAEHPEVEAPDARILWRAEIDPQTLPVLARPIDAEHPDAIARAALEPWLTLTIDSAGEHLLLSDGWRRIRIDVQDGGFADGSPVLFEYRIRGMVSAAPLLLPLRRLLDLSRTGRFSRTLYPTDPRVARWILALRVHDAIRAGASQREIAEQLFGETGRDLLAERRADSLRSRVRRLARDARGLAQGGYLSLLRTRR